MRRGDIHIKTAIGKQGGDMFVMGLFLGRGGGQKKPRMTAFYFCKSGKIGRELGRRHDTSLGCARDCQKRQTPDISLRYAFATVSL